MELVSVPQRVDGSPSFKGQAPPTLSTPPNAVGPPNMYGRADPSRFVTYQPAPPATAVVSTPVSNYRSAEERGAGPSRQRMSLLHPPPQPSAEYIMPQVATPLTPRPDRPSQQSGPPYGGDSGMVKMVPISESPPCKKLRLGTSKPDLHTPLLIDTDRTRSGPAYNPQVEAISPTLPSESMRDESPLRSTKEELLQQIARVDREIAKTESQIAKLKKKKVELEQAATQPQKDSEENSNASDSIIRSLPQCVYTENRKKALEAHQSLDKLGNKVDLPLYNQPSDTAQYHENKLRYASFKTKLLEYFKTRLKEKEKRETYLTTTYAKLSTEWSRRLDKMENNSKKRGKEAKNREIFEKVFPELRKQREDKERFSRVGSRIKSDADLEEIMDGLHEQELEDKKMRSYAVIPPILLDERARKRRCNNRNGIMEDPMQEYKDRQVLNLWTEQERDIFKEKYLQHPKNFGIIKSYLERKNVADCVQYYYLSKKTQNYRQLLRKNRQRTRSTRNQQQQQNNAAAAANSAGGNPTVGLPVVKNEPNGVTTRQQKEQKSDQQATGNSGVGPPNSSNLLSNVNSEAINNNEAGESSNFSGATGEDAMNMATGMSAVPQPPLSDYSCQTKKKRSKEESKENIDMDTSDEENELNGDKGGPHNCAVCKTSLESFLQSRPLVRTQSMQYSLREEDIHPGDRVCTSCRCKAVRRRYKPTCPIPTCPARRARIKRLRPFPPKWGELSEEIREAICAKYQIPPNVTKCCVACFNRISRRLNPNTSLDTPDDPGSDTTRWTDEEIDSFKKALVEFGTDWRKLSERISTKSDLQCRNFYFNFRKKYGLDALVQEFKKSKGGDGPPTLTDEEESGSTTSSCDEGVNPPQDQSRGSLEKKDDYDSSATVSAEEGGPNESEKSHALEEINRGHTDAPLQLTMRPNHTIIQATPPIQAQHISQSPSPHHGGPPHPQLHHNIPSGLVITTQAGLHPHSGGSSSLSLHGPSPHSQPPHHSHVSMHSTSPHPHHSQSPSQGPPGSHSLLGPGMSSHAHIQQQHQHLNSSVHHLSSHPGRYPSPDNHEVLEPMTVKDLMAKTIERQLGRNPVPNHSQNAIPNQSQLHPGPSLSPTITSILTSQDRSHLPPLGQHMRIPQSARNIPTSSPQQQPQPPNLPVTSHYPVFYGNANKVDMRAIPSHHIVRNESGIPTVMQNPLPVQQQMRDECETLDLSMKKRPASPPTPQRSSNAGPPHAHQPLDFAPSRQDDYYQKFASVNRARPQLAPPPPKTSKIVPPPPPLLTKPPVHSPMKDGSITHGTPISLHHPQARFPEPNAANFQHVHNRNSNIRAYPPPQPPNMQNKYEGLQRPSKEGSITQGTPVTVDKGRAKDVSQQHFVYERPDYYKRMSPAAQYYHGPQSQFYGQRPPSTGQQRAPSPSAQSSPYPMDQHNSSRQIIINDYFTSQQMQQPPPTHPPQQSPQNSVQQISRVDPIKRNITPVSVTPGGSAGYVLMPRHEVPYRQSPTPPTSHQVHPQQRQGVIHRANAQRTVVKVEPNRFPHDAFASLVDVAAAQPSLPVPKEEHRVRVGLPRVDMVVREGLGKSMVEMERNNRMTSAPPHQSPQMYRPVQGPPSQFVPDMRNRKEVIESNKSYNRGPPDASDTTLTAASLIDAIITHQINQSSPHDRQSPAPPPRGDKLFASFQRSQPGNVPQQHVGQGHPSGPQYNTSSHHEDMKPEDARPADYKNPQGGTWGDHIDLIISKDYASGKGLTSGQGVPGGQQQQQQQQSSAGTVSAPVSLAQSPHHQPIIQQSKVDEDGMQPYISWKLRRALQHQEQQQQMHQNHPDERHIIRVVQPEVQHHPRPPSVPSSKEINYPPVSEDGNENQNMMLSPGTSGIPVGAPSGTGDLYPRRTSSQLQGITPLDYVKNRIVEVMRTENTDDKGDESNTTSTTETNSSGSGPPISSSSGATSVPVSASSKGIPVSGASHASHHPAVSSPNVSISGSHASSIPKDSSSGTNDNSRADSSQGGGDHRPEGSMDGERQ